MKKYLSLALALVMILALAVPAMAGSAATVADTATLEGVGFHCNHGGSGNGKTDVYSISAGKTYDKKGNVVGVDTGNKFKFDFERVDETTWKLVSEDYACVVCGNNIWASYSNKSGVPSGKNIQVNPYTPPVEEDPTPYSSLSIQKTVDGVPFDEWAAAKVLTTNEIRDILDGMSFTAYLLDGENGNRVVPEQAFPGDIGMTGLIDFGTELPIGWYEVVEEVSGAATSYFVGEGGTMVYYVGETGVSGEVENFVSGREGIGTIVSHDGTGGVEYVLPTVWNNALAAHNNCGQCSGTDAFQKLMEMDAQWIWDCEDTYIYGVSGSAITLEFEVTLGEAIDVPLYFAADNVALIYVNGKLAAFTDVALEGKHIQLGDDYIGIKALGDKGFDDFDGRWNEGWTHAYEAEISLEAGVNEIIIIAANSASTGSYDENGIFVSGTTDKDNDGYNDTNNPCGLIFGFEIPAVTFDNQANYVEYGEVAVNVDVAVNQDTVTFEPVYERTIKDTLVSVGFNAGNGGYDMGNWHTYVEVNVAAAMEGYDIEIAKSSSGKYGFEGIGYFYNVRIEGDELIVSFDDKLIAASYGAYIVNNPSDFPGNAPAHLGKGSSYAFELPAGYGDTVYMYFHMESLTWDDGETLKGWNETSRVNNPVAPVVTELTVELWLGEELIDSQDITNELVFVASFADLEDGEYTVVVKGVANGVEFEETETVIIDENSSEEITINVSVKLADIEIKN